MCFNARLKNEQFRLMMVFGAKKTESILIAFHPRISIRTEQMRHGLTRYIIQISFRVQDSRVYFQNGQFKQRRLGATHVNRKWTFCTLEP